MIEALFSGLSQLLNPYYFGILLLGVAIGIIAGILPGIGGTATLAILIPFVFGLDPGSAIALMIGAMSVIQTSDTITSVLLAVPGSAGGAASIVEGHPMAQRGEAARALAAAFTSSAIGGLIGAVLLVASIPIATPLLKQFSTPEFFMLCMLGVSMVAVLTGRRVLKGLVAAGLGLLLVAVGTAKLAPFARYTFGTMYLVDGIETVLVCLGLYAVPEIIDLMIKGTPIAEILRSGKGTLAGIKDALSNKWLILRCSIIGAYIGFLPGLGASASAWLAYGHTVQTTKDKSGFGKGDVRGLIGPECSNNACRGGELIPTLLFGIPGSASMAIFMSGLMVFGIYAGPTMLTKNLDLVFMIVWSLAIANVIGALICFGLAKYLAKVATIPAHILAPFMLLVVLIATYQISQDWGDLIALLVLGLLGWTMKHLEFSRPALLVAFVLGGISERYLSISVDAYGAAWLLRPWVIGITVVTVISLIAGIRWQLNASRKIDATKQATAEKSR